MYDSFSRCTVQQVNVVAARTCSYGCRRNCKSK